MSPGFRLITTAHFEDQASRLPRDVFAQLKTRLRFLESDPRHPSLMTHEIQNAVGDFGGKIFEAYITAKYRLSWEYGVKRGEIVLRNVDNHDECLKRP